MAWEFVIDSAGKEWAVDRAGLYALVRDHVRSVEIHKRARKVTDFQDVALPTLTSIEIDYEGLGAVVDENSALWWSNAQDRISRIRGEDVLVETLWLRKEAGDKKKEVEQMQRDALSETQRSIASMLGRYDAGKKVFEFIRDAAATTLVVGATLLSGGAAAAALAAGSQMKGIAKWQDTGNVGAAVLESTSAVVVGSIGLGGATTALSGRTLLLIGAGVDGAFDSTKALVDGKSSRTAVLQGLAKFGLTLIGGRLKVDRLGLWQQVAISQATDAGLGMIAPSPDLGPAPKTQGSLTFASGEGSDADYVYGHVLKDPNKVGGAVRTGIPAIRMSNMMSTSMSPRLLPRR